MSERDGTLTAPLRVAITHPTCWPEVRRGSERFLNDFSHWLAARGHEVTVISGSPAATVVCETEGLVRRVLLPRQDPAPLAGRWVTSAHSFGWDLSRVLRAGQFDAVHCMGYHDAAGALLARWRGACFRLVFQCTGIPVSRYFRRIPLDGLLFRQVVQRTDAVVTLSRFADTMLWRDYRIKGVLLPSPTSTEPFLSASRIARGPMVLFCGDADEPRKGAILLARAFPAIAAALPGVRLVYSGRAGKPIRDAIRTALPGGLANRVTFTGLGAVADLPALYASATVCVNPAIWEALGNVLVEALAAGTPIVGCRHGGIPDIVGDERVGTLFDPMPKGNAATNATGLVQAVLRSATLAAQPGMVELCREQARKFSWSVLGPQYEALLAGTRPASGPRERDDASVC